MFFEAQDFKPASISMSNIRQWAADVCQGYLNGGNDPTKSLCKIAQENALTPPQVEVLAGEINKTIHIAKYASAEDKYHAADFPLADAKVALDSLQGSSGAVKTAFVVPDPKVTDNFDFFTAFGVQPDNMEKKASAAEIRSVEQKLASIKTKQDDALYMAKLAASNAEVEFIKEARQMVLSGLDKSDRLKKLANVVHAVNCANMLDAARPTLAKLAYVLGQENVIEKTAAENIMNYLMEKKADITAPQELISEFLNAKVVNGNHPLLIKLKTYTDAEQREQDEASRCGIIDDKNKIFKQTFRAL